MMEAQKQGLFAKQTLTDDELTAIKELEGVCNSYEGLSLRLSWELLRTRAGDKANDFLYYAEGTLVGFLGLYSPGQELEATGMVHSDWRLRGIFRSLLNAAAKEGRRRGASHLLLICEHTSRSGQGFVEAIGSNYRSSEYKMEWSGPLQMPTIDENLSLQRATPGDASFLARLYALCFGEPEEAMLGQITTSLQEQESYIGVAKLGGEPIGTITSLNWNTWTYIAGFGVLPERRGRGYGRQILAMTIQRLLSEGKKQIALEVATDNPSALSLYHSLGFREITSYDYYEYPTPIY